MSNASTEKVVRIVVAENHCYCFSSRCLLLQDICYLLFFAPRSMAPPATVPTAGSYPVRILESGSNVNRVRGVWGVNSSLIYESN